MPTKQKQFVEMSPDRIEEIEEASAKFVDAKAEQKAAKTKATAAGAALREAMDEKGITFYSCYDHMHEVTLLYGPQIKIKVKKHIEELLEAER